MTSTPLRAPGDAPFDTTTPPAGSPEPPAAVDRPTKEWGPGRLHYPGWSTRYRYTLWCSDAAVVGAAVLIAYFLRFGTEPQNVAIMHQTLPYAMVTAAIGAIWMGCLRVTGSRDPRVFGAGADEYSRVARASFWLFGGLAICEVLLRPGIARGFEVIALPLGTLGLLVTRWGWRHRLTARRLRGEALERLLLVGSVESSAALAERLSATPALGYAVVGLCAAPERALGHVEIDPVNHPGVPIVGDWDSVGDAVQTTGATTVAVTAASMLGPDMMQSLCWELDEIDVRLFVAPGLVDVSGPRVLMRPMAGLPLLHISRPQYKGAVRLWKCLSDKAGAAVLLVVLSPVLLAVAAAIKLDSRGPIFYRAVRVGYHNEPFRMWKFRSMVVDADARRAALAGSDDGNGILFKMKDDPRVTHVGKWIRRFSLDEIPQLLNVLAGDMSIVGPRPPLTEEVATYDGRVSRRMLVRPGMTGLWQVSGRSDLTWEESVRLDLYYVENWSLMQDLVILWRTARAVLSKNGAY